ncbi:hypothetical protein PRABACTJOHN_03746 [Parabacteroides johnsonii DSM 18315]|uniref:Uncharacterized protein n=1 Tax=Parabacteroides johnsonii DSM 18315 TaxID=537006 RepID=B7BFB7_9BACT|nr:hypothetical protein PRABACTJOHN_03746 [Parabacteroides johnsonii DSM 18315]
MCLFGGFFLQIPLFSVFFVVCLNHKYKNKMGLNLIIGKGEEAV